MKADPNSSLMRRLTLAAMSSHTSIMDLWEINYFQYTLVALQTTKRAIRDDKLFHSSYRYGQQNSSGKIWKLLARNEITIYRTPPYSRYGVSLFMLLCLENILTLKSQLHLCSECSSEYFLWFFIDISEHTRQMTCFVCIYFLE